jgi:hypothetical protein
VKAKATLVTNYTNTISISDIIQALEEVVSAQYESQSMITVMRYLSTDSTALLSI